MAIDTLPAIRVEEILNADEITPVTRKEYFLQKPVMMAADALDAASEAEASVNAIAASLTEVLPVPAAADEGKVLTANSAGGASWEEASGGGAKNSVFHSVASYNVKNTYSLPATNKIAAAVSQDYVQDQSIQNTINIANNLVFEFPETPVVSYTVFSAGLISVDAWGYGTAIINGTLTPVIFRRTFTLTLSGSTTFTIQPIAVYNITDGTIYANSDVTLSKALTAINNYSTFSMRYTPVF